MDNEERTKSGRDYPDETESIDLLVQKGIRYLEQEDYDQAIERIREALKLAPFRQDIKELLAQALDRRPEVTRKIKPIDGDKEIVPRSARKPGINVGLWLFLFTILTLTSVAFFFFFSSSIQTFISNIARPNEEKHISPTDREAAALYKSAELLQDQRRYSEAIDEIKKALEKKPTDRKRYEMKLATLYYLIGESHDKNDDYIKAIDSYEKAIQNNPEYIDAYYGLGWANYLQGRKNQNRRLKYQSYYDKALVSLQKILELDATHIRARDTLARVYIAMNDTAKAAEMYRQIIRQNPESGEAERARRSLKSMGFRE
ncbi:tetratricopeptide repeat protein [Candidatus Sumerlaeota bacterium]|nr:tetratricopeptide repeat protein [Candidatus Sumerlaeota bacterium]